MSTTDGATTNVVLVHGAFADGSGWRRVYDLPPLAATASRLCRTRSPRSPMTSPRQTARWTQQDGPAILVGHSWGGTVITEAGVHPKVAGLVYVSALIPDVGETSGQQYEGFAATPEFVIDVDRRRLRLPQPRRLPLGIRRRRERGRRRMFMSRQAKCR